MHSIIERGDLAMVVRPWLEPVAFVLEIVGIAVIVLSVIGASLRYVRDRWYRLADSAYEAYRSNLGRGILLGLEILIGADIIATITAPLTWESVGLLGVIVLIRTFLSFSLECELEGEWPWKRRQRDWQQRSALRRETDSSHDANTL